MLSDGLMQPLSNGRLTHKWVMIHKLRTTVLEVLLLLKILSCGLLKIVLQLLKFLLHIG